MSLPMCSANSACVGVRPNSAAKEWVASLCDLLMATAERGKNDMRRTSSKIAPRTRLWAKFSNSMPLEAS